MDGGGPGTSAEEHGASESPTFRFSLKDPEKLFGLQSVSFETFQGKTPNTDLFSLEGAETFLSSVTSVIYYVWEVPLCLLAPNLGGFFFFFFCKLTEEFSKAQGEFTLHSTQCLSCKSLYKKEIFFR